MTEVLLTVGAVALCCGFLWLAYRMEPHWVAKDASRFLTTAQAIDRLGTVIGRKREVRVTVLPDGGLRVSRRSMVRSKSAIWRVQAKSPNPPHGRQIYLLRQIPAHPDGELLALRVPDSSRIVPTLDGLTPADPVNVPPPDPRSRRWGRRADPG